MFIVPPRTEHPPLRRRPLAQGRFALCRYGYSAAFADPEQSSPAPLTVPNFHPDEAYGELMFAGQ
jgi:hypothetical protein